ncbi:MAG: phosphoglycolate phosphatase [Neisseriaceae bacterium]|nr:phosphoglycolate phosphatase [Neisseriaceae bacterium]
MTEAVTIKAFAFDLDGTLIDSVADLAAAANHMRSALNLAPLPSDTITAYVGDGISTLVHRCLTDSTDGQAEASLWQQGFTLFIQHYYAHLTDLTQIYPNVLTGLELLKSEGYPLVVITNKSERFAIKAITDLGMSDYFSLIIGGDTLPEKKPSPTPILHACEVLNILPAELVMVGDSGNDILAAKAAGTPVIGVNYGYEDMYELSQNDATKPNLVIEKLTQLFDYLHPSEIKH